MKAIEFIASAEDGIIRIPKKYWKDTEQKFRVILLVEEDLPKVAVKKAKGRRLQAMSVKTKGLVFDRDEANER